MLKQKREKIPLTWSLGLLLVIYLLYIIYNRECNSEYNLNNEDSSVDLDFGWLP